MFAPKTKLFGLIPRENDFDSRWNYFMSELCGTTLNDLMLIKDVVEANLEHFMIKDKINIKKKFSKYFETDFLNEVDAKLKFLNNLKCDLKDDV